MLGRRRRRDRGRDMVTGGAAPPADRASLRSTVTITLTATAATIPTVAATEMTSRVGSRGPTELQARREALPAHVGGRSIAMITTRLPSSSSSRRWYMPSRSATRSEAAFPGWITEMIRSASTFSHAHSSDAAAASVA
jgi:hypothetical protein